MEAYYSDGRGRYGTGESYDWFPKYGEEAEVFLSSDGLWSYDEVEGGIELLRYNGNEIHIAVPDMVDGRKVVSMNNTFDGFYELKSAVVPEGIRSIVGAFYGCEGLEKIVLPDTLEDMGYAFECCYSLKNIDVPEHVKNFSWAFGRVPLEQFAFPQGTENISRAFLGCSHLRKVFIPKTVTDCYEAFSDCEALTEVILEEGVSRINEWAFFHCTSLREITIPKSVTEFGRYSVGFMEVREYDERRTGYRIRGKQVVPGFKIRGVPGSEAEKYAKENGIEFVSVSRE